MEHGKPIFLLHMEVLRAHRDVGRGSLKKRRPSCRSRDPHRVGGWLGFFLDQRSKQISSPFCYPKVGRIGRVSAPERRMKWGAGFSFYNPFDMIGPATFPLSLMFRGGIHPRTTSLVVARKARTQRTSRAPFPFTNNNKGKKASTRTTFLLRADVAKCLTLLVIVPCRCGWCSFARAWTNPRKGCLSGHLRMIRAVWRETLTYSLFFLGGKEPDRVPPLTWPGPKWKWSGGPTHPNQGYAGIREEQHLTMFMTNWILTYQ